MSLKNKYFGLDQGEGQVEEQEPGFHKGMLLRKKVSSSDENEAILNTSEPYNYSKDNTKEE